MSADTIFAAGSGAGRRAVTVLRLSGPATERILEELCRTLPPPREARLRRLRERDGEVLDHALVLWFPGPASYTGEDCGELHLHGGAAVLADVAAALVNGGARPAEPGEFTRRAFVNGRMDLLEAEAIADLAEAETSAQRRQALSQLDGGLGAVMADWARRLAWLTARQEALIDFPDEDLPASIEQEDHAEMATLRREMAHHLADNRRGERLRSGLVVVVSGPPNVGKSSLVNALARRDAAIVAPLPGTTRDIVEVRVTIGDVPVTLVDTAGLRETDDDVEAEGVRRARRRADEADLVLLVRDATHPLDQTARPSGRVLEVVNKIDLVDRPVAGLRVSAHTGEGLESLRTALCGAVRELTSQAGPPPLTRERHRAALRDAVDSLKAAAEARLAELRAEELRLALRSLGRITGEVGTEDLLGLIFSAFCIGK